MSWLEDASQNPVGLALLQNRTSPPAGVFPLAVSDDYPSLFVEDLLMVLVVLPWATDPARLALQAGLFGAHEFEFIPPSPPPPLPPGQDEQFADLLRVQFRVLPPAQVLLLGVSDDYTDFFPQDFLMVLSVMPWLPDPARLILQTGLLGSHEFIPPAPPYSSYMTIQTVEEETWAPDIGLLQRIGVLDDWPWSPAIVSPPPPPGPPPPPPSPPPSPCPGAMSTLDIVTRFQSLYRETSARYFNTQWQLDAMSDAIDDLATEIEPLNPDFLGSKMFQLGYVAGQREYPLSSDFGYRVIKVEVTDLGGPPFQLLRAIDFEDIGALGPFGPSAPQFASGGLGEPVAFYVRTGSPASGLALIGFDPIPDRTATSNVQVWYDNIRCRVPSIDPFTFIDLPPDFGALVALKMCILAATADNHPSLAAWVAMYNSRLERLLGMVLRGREMAPEDFDISGDF